MEQESLEFRKRRVARIKKWILGICVFLLVFPMVLSISLIFVERRQLGIMEDMALRLESLSARVDSLEQARTKMAEENKLLGETLAEKEQTIAGMQEELDTILASLPDPNEKPAPAAHNVYLTFDDGPSSRTNEILDILAQYDVKATFFVVGKTDEASLAAYKRIVEEGHTLGMHSYSHKYSELYASEENFREDFEQLYQLLTDTTGVSPQFYRFPGGSSNKVSPLNMQRFVDILTEKGITHFDWNLSSGDASGVSMTALQMADAATKDIAHKSTAVVLMHDAADKATTVNALPLIIERIQAIEDTAILPITSDTPPVQYLSQAPAEEAQ